MGGFARLVEDVCNWALAVSLLLELVSAQADMVHFYDPRLKRFERECLAFH